MRCHPLFDLGLAPEVDRRAAWIEQQLAGFAPEPAHQGASHHAMLTGDPDELISQIEDHRDGLPTYRGALR
jgi:hypothetical protein